MGYHRVSLSEEAYHRLKSLKKKGQSFSDLIMELTVSKIMQKSFWDHGGTWADMTDEEADTFLNNAKEMWKE